MANQVKDVSRRIGQLTGELGAELATISETMVTELERQQGRRLTGLALNMIDVIDRNLYERSCDVRWWATDAAIVDAATGAAQAAAHASSRMSVILDSCTVYLDIWILDLEGHVIANGRPAAFPVVGVANAKDQPWFEAALHTRSGDEYVTANVDKVRELGGAHAAAYATAIREGAARNGRIVGVLSVFFDWTKQASAVVDNVWLSNDERARTRSMIVDAKGRVIADSGQTSLASLGTDQYELRSGGSDTGAYCTADGAVVGYALTPGYESYQGMGWFGVIEQRSHPGA